MLQINTEHKLTISFINTPDSANNDIKTFVGILTKCQKDSVKPGFNKLFDETERVLIKDLYDSIVP